MNTFKTFTEKHNLISETRFQLKSYLLILKRQFQNTFSGVEKFSDKRQLKSAPIISFSESNLWNLDDNDQNWILTAGKIQNLRLAARRLNGIEIDANKIFSFWKHLGNPNIGQGYVIGREIREGCIVPTIAGGLCQLSNALYDAALKAAFEIVERHRHTQVIKGSLAEQDRDATVKWNYVDLRFKSTHSFRIEIEITTDKLIVKFRSSGESERIVSANNILLKSSKLNDCYSCGNLECFKHPVETLNKHEREITTFILDEKWSEYDNYIKAISKSNDFFIIPLIKNRFIKTNRYDWTFGNSKNIKATSFIAIKRALYLRFASKFQSNIFSLMLRFDKKIAAEATELIPIESTHLIISQNLLPYLWAQGVLAGRTFDVLMTRLPMELLHKRLDIAHKNFPESKTLNDFRASQSLIDLEKIALTKSRHIITPHTEIGKIFTNKAINLKWTLPKIGDKQNIHGDKILFPASALGRKGAYEIKKLAEELNLSIVISGNAAEKKNFWEGIDTEVCGINPLANVRLVIYPAYAEHQPRLLLKALAKGIPVIATTACGLSPTDNLIIVPIGDYETLKQTVKQFLNINPTLKKHS